MSGRKDTRTDTRTVHVDVPVEELTLRRYTLKVLHGPDKGMEKSFETRQLFIGTGPECRFRLNDPTVSRSHARIEFDPNGYRISDEGSKNGVRVSDRRVMDAYLPAQAEINLGETRILFSLGTETVDIAIARETRFGGLVGRSVEMREVFGILKKVAPTDPTVLIEGESGTGKELVAEALHKFGPRKGRPFVVFDCSACPRDLLESELFGHVRGAFTGAVRDRKGALEEATGGTLFLDEVGELPLDMQPKLLRALEKLEVKPVGGNRRVHLDVRIICATNRNLSEEVAAGNFREDLYYRLGIIHILLPPLRKRPDDIPLLSDHFLGELTAASGAPKPRLAYETMEKLKEYPWPGNVRELRNFLERSIILAGASQGAEKPLELTGPRQTTRLIGADPDEVLRVSFDEPFKDVKDQLVRDFETRYFTRLLRRTEGNVSKAARLAGIHRKSLEYLLKQIEVPDLKDMRDAGKG
ncbi:MAG: sigma 54-dependent Fis family transcriptional regulator [Deltaproteobacteria bacterium]|nr:sigma 54-dependent Fis family transcriptional regulator [Deltaproteobacteria bacterium]